MRCKAICRDFDRECEFLQGTNNGAAFNKLMALSLQKPLRQLMNIIWTRYCQAVVAEHWQLKPEAYWVRLPATAGLFTFLFSPHSI